MTVDPLQELRAYVRRLFLVGALVACALGAFVGAVEGWTA